MEEKEYKKRFIDLWEKIHDDKNGYFKKFNVNGKSLKVPYHSIETLMCEAPDYGHETTSETFSYYIWLEAMYGKLTGNFDSFKDSWESTEAFIIPHGKGQNGIGAYNPSSPATLANEYPTPDKYPSRLHFGEAVGQDPINNELKNAYNSSEMYGMHWLLDVDNWYGYGDDTAPVYINTFQRGPMESVWRTIPHPSIEEFKYGGRNGFLDLFTGDNNYSKQWRYTIAPDADARAIQATYWADIWAKDHGKNVDEEVSKSAKMGDYLRYSMFDKYFKNIGIGSNSPSNTSQHYLLSWYYAWGGGIEANWAWKIGCSHNHFGYQNPMTAWILTNIDAFKPKSSNGVSDWKKSLERQLEFYQWLQSSEGAIAGGATNSYMTEAGSYQKYPSDLPTFYGMAYDWKPVYHDPPSNNWFGMQGWSMERVAEYLYETGDKKAMTLLEKWVKWVKSVIKLYDNGDFEIPNNLEWSGNPDNWTGSYTGNPNLHVKVSSYGKDLGITAAVAQTLLYYSAATKKYGNFDKEAKDLGKELLDRMWNLYQDDKGYSVEEEREDYSKFFETEVYVPSGWSGKMANGDEIKSGIKFLDIRSKYKDDPDYDKVLQAYKGNKAPVFRYHRFWAEASIAIANGVYSILSEEFGDVETLKGDINGDGTINVLDYALLQQYLVGKSVIINKENSDINGDGKINSTDLMLLRKLVLNRA
ncbi:endoglucanase [Clostridium bornimense]|uniref:glycoside hydrolase family 48 protein n=1 Tax=Clostridium bornimense TaxID=1216932 RepID=UPI001C122471|nr:glycoside hydrolase family 48 protein [Clostridium bornimense]MBU5317069.1 endoglucanase [Clostridium bornimense]